MLPFFYNPEFHDGNVVLDETTSKHITGVLRMKKGDKVMLTNGRGKKALAVITDDHRKHCTVESEKIEVEQEGGRRVNIGISLIKNVSRFEWFLEKVTEIGVRGIYPMICERTEKEKFRFDRMNQILISAMLQSQQAWLPKLHEPMNFENVLEKNESHSYIAHCLPEEKNKIVSLSENESALLLIGPEGDFSPNEIQLALESNFIPVTLGDTRLRTETAGVVGAVKLLG